MIDSYIDVGGLVIALVGMAVVFGGLVHEHLTNIRLRKEAEEVSRQRQIAEEKAILWAEVEKIEKEREET